MMVCLVIDDFYIVEYKITMDRKSFNIKKEGNLGKVMEKRYLELLAKEYPNIQSAASEIINLNAIQCLPKGTEYFFSDLHGEYEAFIHLLKSASGVIRTKIDDLFGKTISKKDRMHLAELIYYPERQLREIALEGEALQDW